MKENKTVTREEGSRLKHAGKDRHRVLFVLVFLFSFFYIIWRLFFTLPWRFGIVSIIFGCILWFCESSTIIETFTHFNNVSKVKIPDMPWIPDDMYPDVDVMIATHNESAELLYKTLNGCNYLKYPDKSKIHVILCDDNNRPEIAELAKQMGVQYYGVTGNKYAKAGNLNYALPLTHSPLIAIFDADMIPTSDFLLETVPYFFSKEMIQENGRWRRRTPQDEPDTQKELGYVQTQQSFYNPDPLQRNLFLERDAPNEQDYFYRSVNVARMNTESAAFAGSNTLFSRKALKDAGWFATHSITEDFATSIEILGRGYRSIAVDKELAHGLSPEDVPGFIKQRQRWSRGAAQGIMTSKFWKSKLPLKTRWNFLVSYFYWWTFIRRMIYVIAPILYALFGIFAADVSLIQLLSVWLPYYLIYNTGLRVMSDGTTSSLWSDTVDTIQFPYMISPIILGTLRIPQSKFVVTSKDRQTGRNSHISLAIPHIILAVLMLVSIVICVYQIAVMHYEGALVVLFWALMNMFALVNSIVYYRGRANSRYYERVATPLPVSIRYQGREIPGVTEDISEGGMAVLLEQPEYLPPEEDISLTVSYRKDEDTQYQAAMRMQVKYVKQNGSRWKYSMMVTDISEKDRQEYLQIIYDRNHLFPKKVQIGITKDIRLIMEGMRQKTQAGQRKLQRITPLEPVFVRTREAGDVQILDFNYRCFSLKSEEKLPELLTLCLTEDYSLSCRAVPQRRPRGPEEGALYEIEEWEKLTADKSLEEAVFTLFQIPVGKEEPESR